MTQATAPSSAITEYNPILAALVDIEKHRGVLFDVTTQRGMKDAKAAHKEVAAVRIALEKTRKKVKEDVVARGKLIDGEANKYFAQISAIEDPLKDQIEAEERREQAAREAAIKAEADRLAKEEADRKAAEERKLAEEWAKLEAEAKRLADERAQLEAEQRAARAQIDEEVRQARAARQAEEDRLAADRQKLDDERRAKEDAERQVREAEEALQRRQQAEADAKAKAEREKQEAAERERRLKEAEALDSRRMLETFCERYGDLHPELAKHIRVYLTTAPALRVAA